MYSFTIFFIDTSNYYYIIIQPLRVLNTC